MEEFLNTLCHITVAIPGRDKPWYFVCADVTKLTDTHISFIDKTKKIMIRNEETNEYEWNGEYEKMCYRRIDIINIRASSPGDIQ